MMLQVWQCGYDDECRYDSVGMMMSAGMTMWVWWCCRYDNVGMMVNASMMMNAGMTVQVWWWMQVWWCCIGMTMWMTTWLKECYIMFLTPQLGKYISDWYSTPDFASVSGNMSLIHGALLAKTKIIIGKIEVRCFVIRILLKHSFIKFAVEVFNR